MWKDWAFGGVDVWGLRWAVLFYHRHVDQLWVALCWCVGVSLGVGMSRNLFLLQMCVQELSVLLSGLKGNELGGYTMLQVW